MQSDAVTEKRPRSRTTSTMIAALAIVPTLAMGTVFLWNRGPTISLHGHPSRVRVLGVYTFQAAKGGHDDLGEAIAESLAYRLSNVPGLATGVVRSRFGRPPDFAIKGEITNAEGRVVITVHLDERDRHRPLWTGTFWRGDSVGSPLVSDLASSLNEALTARLRRK